MAKGTLAATLGMGLRTAGQVVVFLLVARVMGVENYGIYAAVLALAASAGCFSGLGTQSIVVREISRQPYDFGKIWGKSLAALAVTTPLLFLLYLAVTWVALPADIANEVVLLIGLAEIVFAPFVLATITLYQGYGKMNRASQLIFLPVLPRLLS
ncbi:MAG: oligosaccharide flippase family protein, partial [Candidatus Marinimicrobia bacterium]|nr:oligosaccharide flippase family protein [Candidatus Neomarinimicrobiota bacterium]